MTKWEPLEDSEQNSYQCSTWTTQARQTLQGWQAARQGDLLGCPHTWGTQKGACLVGGVDRTEQWWLGSLPATLR